MERAREYLEKYARLDGLIRRRERQLEELTERRERYTDGLLGAQRYDLPRVQGGELGDPTAGAVLRMEEIFYERVERLQGELARLWAEYDCMRWQLDGCELDKRERRLIEYRFMRGMDRAEAALRMNYSERTLDNIWQGLAKKMGEEIS